MNQKNNASLSLSAAAGLLCLALAGSPIVGQQLLSRIDNPDPTPELDVFGSTVTMRDGLAIVGAPNARRPGDTSFAGAAYIFRQVSDEWTLEQALFHPDPNVGLEPNRGHFGFSVDISSSTSGDVAVVGIVFDVWDPVAFRLMGAAYVYRHDGSQWVLEQRLAERNFTGFADFFGNSVSVSGDVIVVGAPIFPGSSPPTGAFYIYRYVPENEPGERWVEEVEGHVPVDAVGTPAQVGDPVLVIGAPVTGTAYVYRHVENEWMLEQRLHDLLVDSESNPILSAGSIFGRSVSISNDTVVVGSPGFHADGVDRAGAAFIFRRLGDGSWIWETELTAPDPIVAGFFGNSVAVNGDLALAGLSTANLGGAYLYRFDGSEWIFVDKILHPGAQPDDRFGRVAMDATSGFIGAPHDSILAQHAGAVYHYRLFNSPIGENITTNPVDSATGDSPATITFTEITSPGTTTIEITTEAPPLPSGFKLTEPEVFYDIQTTATFDGDITICISYDPTNVPDPEALELRHHNGVEWVDITTTRDPVNNTICGETSSLSPFAIFQPLPATDPLTMLMELSIHVASVNLHHGIQNSLDAKLDAALNALESASHNDRPAAANALQAFINQTQAQSGNHIPPEVATELIARAQQIIVLLDQ